MKPEVWVILDEKEAQFLKTGGSIATTGEGGQHVRISYFPKAEPEQPEFAPQQPMSEESGERP